MKKDEWFQHKWHYMKRFAKWAMIGFLLMIAGAFVHFAISIIGMFLFFPLLFWLVMVPLLHWKDRYKGEKSALWGALILVETSGWLKIVYWFRHILPDYHGQGRYAETKSE